MPKITAGTGFRILGSRCGKASRLSFKRAVMTEVYEAMRETFDVPEDDRFMTITEHGKSPSGSVVTILESCDPMT